MTSTPPLTMPKPRAAATSKRCSSSPSKATKPRCSESSAKPFRTRASKDPRPTPSVCLPQWSYSYDPFGNSRSATKVNPLAADNPMRFTGEDLDPPGSIT